MANKKPGNIIIPPQGGMMRDFVMRLKLIWRLVRDPRINPWLKLIPIGGLLYLISPFDLIPDIVLPLIGELDDVAVLWVTNYLFVEFCPPEIVQEHVKALTSNMDIVNGEDVVDGEVTDSTEDKKE